jgi:hypothetical protein
VSFVPILTKWNLNGESFFSTNFIAQFWNWLWNLPDSKSWLKMVHVKIDIISHGLYERNWGIIANKLIM